MLSDRLHLRSDDAKSMEPRTFNPLSRHRSATREGSTSIGFTGDWRQTGLMTNGRRQVIVVDAANVIGSVPDGWWRDRPGAARKLLLRLASLQERLPDTTDVVVILEGAARAAVSGPDAPDVGTVRVVLADGSGDDTIVAVTAECAAQDSSPEVTVVTADRGLRQRIHPTGATPEGPRWLLNQLDQ